MQAFAAFATSETGKVYADVCERYGLDPGAPFDDDDVLAFNFRVALAARPRTEEPDVDAVPNAKVVTDLDRQMRTLSHGG